MDKVDDFVNVEDMLKALIDPQRAEVEKAEKKANLGGGHGTDRYYTYHRTRGHRIEDCRNLKHRIEVMLENEELE